jgi:hypothetical protein
MTPSPRGLRGLPYALPHGLAKHRGLIHLRTISKEYPGSSARIPAHRVVTSRMLLLPVQ